MMRLAKNITLRVVTIGLLTAAVFGGVAWWQTPAQTKSGIVSGTGRLVGWAALALVLPWATFFLTAWVAKQDSNLWGAILVLAYTVAAGVTLAWLFGFQIAGAAGWIGFTAAVLVAGVYNLLVCDWIADKASE